MYVILSEIFWWKYDISDLFQDKCLKFLAKLYFSKVILLNNIYFIIFVDDLKKNSFNELTCKVNEKQLKRKG